MESDRSSQRPTPRWHHATVELEHLAIITWAVDADHLAALLPQPFRPDIRDGVGLVSAVAFRVSGFRFRAAPFIRMSCGQVDYRAYVRRDGEVGVWSLGTSLGSNLAIIPRHLWRMPWHRTAVDIEAGWSGERLDRWRLGAHGAWGAADAKLVGNDDPAKSPPLAERDASGRSLFDPFVGWYARRDGSGHGRCTVWHHPVDLADARVEAARFDVLTGLGLIDVGQAPVSAGVERRLRFDVHTPPRRIAP